MQNIQIRTFRLHLAIIGYLTYCFSTIYFGQHPWAECLTIDKIISVVSVIFILQHTLMNMKDISKQLKWIYYLSLIVFIYIHFIG
jgi:hypothetical protein